MIFSSKVFISRVLSNGDSMGSGISPKVAEYVEKYLRSPAVREQMMFLLNRIALGECVTWSEVASTSVKLHF
ncbi:MAG: hypothetical protein QXD83_05150 [Sulfolobales archaeon]